ncbi:MAG: 5-(carboxyamino)imidazole ribonucleotide mutase [Deltaproteobacteria bacterium]|nr:5-(carboxyamino)imidazole ribonucleotide mutase [Deltaproteobacteria bacterium]PWB60875.1 MAG: 5-(carboxyamino)imidazole ribonucleotide mutase [Deltaproteobacteria bacterium]
MAGKVLILMGSKSDAEVMGEASRILAALGVPCTTTVASAHRSPGRTQKLAREAEGQGYSVIIAGAGAAAHLAGVVAAETVLPVIGVPLASSPLSGLDSLLSTAQMPGGVPVATMAVGKAGAQNAAYLAAQILALSDPRLRKTLAERRRQMAEAVDAAAEDVR